MGRYRYKGRGPSLGLVVSRNERWRTLNTHLVSAHSISIFIFYPLICERFREVMPGRGQGQSLPARRLQSELNDPEPRKYNYSSKRKDLSHYWCIRGFIAFRFFICDTSVA